MKGYWLCAGKMPAVTFRGGAVYYEPGWAGVDVEQKWADLISDVGGRTVDIRGHLALVQPATGEETKPQVMIVIGDTLVRLLGPVGGSSEPLLTIADSLSLPATR